MILNPPYSPELLLHKSTENSLLLNTMINAQLSPYLTYQQHLPNCTTLLSWNSFFTTLTGQQLTWSPSSLVGHCFSISLTALVFIFLTTLVLKYIMVQSFRMFCSLLCCQGLEHSLTYSWYSRNTCLKKWINRIIKLFPITIIPKTQIIISLLPYICLSKQSDQISLLLAAKNNI